MTHRARRPAVAVKSVPCSPPSTVSLRPAPAGHFEAAERETVVTWSDADEGTATIYTAQRPVMRKLRAHPLAQLVDARDGGETWTLPARCVAFRKPRRRHA